MPPKQQNTAPLPLTGVPSTDLSAALPQTPPPFVPQLADPAAVQAQAIARQQALQQQATTLYPESTPASILATLSGLAGNIAGALTGQGAVGNPAVEFGQQLMQRQRQEQDQFVALTNQEELRIRQEEKTLTDLQNRKLQAESLIPVIQRIPDTDLQVALLAQNATGDVEGVRAGLAQYEQLKRQKEMDQFSREYKADLAESRDEREKLSKLRFELSLESEKRRAEQREREISLRDRAQREGYYQKDIADYRKNVAPLNQTAENLSEVYSILGDPDSPEAQAKLARLLGAGGAARGVLPRLASAEDRRLAQAIGKLFYKNLRSDVGANFTGIEEKVAEAFTGYGFGKKLGTTLVNSPDQLANGIKAVERELKAQLDARTSSYMPGTLERMRESRMLNLPDTVETIENLKKLGGGVDLNRQPKRVTPQQWQKADRQTRIKYLLETGDR